MQPPCLLCVKECYKADPTQVTSLMDAPLPEDPHHPGSVALKPEESNPTQPNPPPPPGGDRVLCALTSESPST